MKHANISIFIPHLGCKSRCSFCNQLHITGCSKLPDENDIDAAVSSAIDSKSYNRNKTQLAFFGGSFTAIDREYMHSLLKAAKKHIDLGNVSSVRISTRPDKIDREILKLLSYYGVKSIELGAQSMSDEVLRLNRRGHSRQQVIESSNLIKESGFELGLQMMTGLYGDNNETSLETANMFINLNADTVRIYPTIVLKNTMLEKLFNQGSYRPQTLDEAVNLGAKLLKLFIKNDINIIRFGLHAIDHLQYVAGPWHDALAELTYSKMYFDFALNQLLEKHKGKYSLFVSPSELSKMIGQHRGNINALLQQGYDCNVKADLNVYKYTVKINERT